MSRSNIVSHPKEFLLKRRTQLRRVHLLLLCLVLFVLDKIICEFLIQLVLPLLSITVGTKFLARRHHEFSHDELLTQVTDRNGVEIRHEVVGSKQVGSCHVA
jgi:hypothetical protein